MKKRSFWHRVSIRWKAFWRTLDQRALEYHKLKNEHPDWFMENQQL